ncbi:MAG: M1 family metallopeptidase [Saprospiraceae bacterium]|nr:M1 family metallopeptidase [Saprospiraceae bacterium]
MRFSIILIIHLVLHSVWQPPLYSQSLFFEGFTRADTLRGSITPERQWWDLIKYELSIRIEPDKKYIEGANLIHYVVLQPASTMQIDLQSPLTINRVTQNGTELEFTREGNAHFIKLNEHHKAGSIQQLQVEYSGHPHEAVNPPWDGGFIWSKDEEGNPFIATACQGIGASIWWPCKDHMYDEPDSGMIIKVIVPGELTAVANGKLVQVEEITDSYRQFTWQVKNPINNYGVNVNIGDYKHFSEAYSGEAGPLEINYWVLPENLEKAKIQFKDVPKMLEAFEYWFGPYPFYDDGFKLVEVPYTGMEHQSSITYGNGYRNGYRGVDVSGTGWGLKFDFIIIHESAHEWFANNITYRDVADMWIHESFAAYAEGLFVEYHFGKGAGDLYLRGIRSNIENQRPVIGYYNVNQSGSGDMYPKGANMLHTLRLLVDDDEKWRRLLREMNHTFYHQTVSTEEIELFISDFLQMDLHSFFNQYLRDIRVPVFEYRIDGKELSYRWSNCISTFDMPIRIKINGKRVLLEPVNSFQQVQIEPGAVNEIEIDPNLYIVPFDLLGK